ncbi:hypothetical protein [Homoserinibacter sp. GY 40078]|uniref:hypothetical protein n=1 Tax=Homoserinibacter sp. GY 40078 TaxID=2603275 RepID=UPI0011C851F2|nr:hypothetical protein [Homoserinibacter sp. GY 40078]TXK18942.1 hypothetical protein FVQ89_03125 [Homoserinibacter sp. GY 40078]
MSDVPPIEIERLRGRVAELHAIAVELSARAARVPRVGPEAWRGPAYESYRAAVERLACGLGEAAHRVVEVERLAWAELQHVL